MFLVLIPTAGTRYEVVQPPEPEAVGEILAEARLRFPTSLQWAACGPKALMGAADLLAVRAGANVIVNPVRAAVTLAEELGLSWRTATSAASLPRSRQRHRVLTPLACR